MSHLNFWDVTWGILRRRDIIFLFFVLFQYLSSMRCLSLDAIFAVTNKLRITRSQSGVYESEILLKYPRHTFHPYHLNKLSSFVFPEILRARHVFIVVKRHDPRAAWGFYFQTICIVTSCVSQVDGIVLGGVFVPCFYSFVARFRGILHYSNYLAEAVEIRVITLQHGSTILEMRVA